MFKTNSLKEINGMRRSMAARGLLARRSPAVEQALSLVAGVTLGSLVAVSGIGVYSISYKNSAPTIDTLLAMDSMSPVGVDLNSPAHKDAPIQCDTPPEGPEFDQSPYQQTLARKEEEREARAHRLTEAYASLDHDVPQDTLETVTKGASDAGVEAAYLLATASQESRMDTVAKASNTSAKGLFQFTNATWMRAVKRFGQNYHDLAPYQDAIFITDKGNVGVNNWKVRTNLLKLRDNPYLATVMTAELSKDDQQRLEKALGRPANHTDMYFLHLLGLKDAEKFLRATVDTPHKFGKDVVKTASGKNSSLFYDDKKKPLTVAEIQVNVHDSVERLVATFSTILQNSKPEEAQTVAMLP